LKLELTSFVDFASLLNGSSLARFSLLGIRYILAPVEAFIETLNLETLTTMPYFVSFPTKYPGLGKSVEQEVNTVRLSTTAVSYTHLRRICFSIIT
jgi:hypothetical protein